MVAARIRPLEMKDLNHIMEWVNDPTVVGKFANFQTPISREREQKFLEQIIASETDKLFAIETEQGEYLGNIGLHQIDWPSRAGRLALIIGKKAHWGEGYAQSALQELLRLAFEQYNLHKVWLVVFEENAKARHIYEKAGFQIEGFLRDEYFHQGEYHNMVRMSMLEHEYFARRGTQCE
ncbi:GNAT family N-acetyltransferase [Candidatus Woesearchaeota archaeon]|nr:GNAT family N-acetyltransferase [Candidatus Woesearchaeota archaeon]